MLYGFAEALNVDFLMAAGKAWEGLTAPHGARLAAKVGLWLAARLSAVGSPNARSHSVEHFAALAAPGFAYGKSRHSVDDEDQSVHDLSRRVPWRAAVNSARMASAISGGVRPPSLKPTGPLIV